MGGRTTSVSFLGASEENGDAVNNNTPLREGKKEGSMSSQDHQDEDICKDMMKKGNRAVS